MIHGNYKKPLGFSTRISSINFHLWEYCNMKCKFCFAKFQDSQSNPLSIRHLKKKQALKLVELIGSSGFRKITFSGGEPTLCGWLSDLLYQAKTAGMITMIVTNGATLTEGWLDKVANYLDWVALSVDSVIPKKLISTGRCVNGIPLSEQRYLHLSNEIKKRGIRLKLNTVVTSLTWQDNMTDFVRAMKPERWKIFQILPINVQNNEQAKTLLISNEEFSKFVQTNCIIQNDGIRTVAETNELMTGSYLMIDPIGRLVDNSTGAYKYSRPILEIGIETALQEIQFFEDRFFARNGDYFLQKNNPC